MDKRNHIAQAAVKVILSLYSTIALSGYCPRYVLVEEQMMLLLTSGIVLRCHSPEFVDSLTNHVNPLGSTQEGS